MKKIYFGILYIFFSCAAAYATIHPVNVEDFEFDPSSLTVNFGDTVRWEWDNSAGSHTTTSVSVPSGAANWDQPIDASNQVFEYVVTIPGNYNYKCSFHGDAMGMVGSFNATGSTAVNNIASGSYFNLYNNIVTNAIQITFNLSRDYLVRLRLYDMKGILIKDLSEATHPAGIYSETYSTGELIKGIYLLEISAGNDIVVKKIVVE